PSPTCIPPSLHDALPIWFVQTVAVGGHLRGSASPPRRGDPTAMVRASHPPHDLGVAGIVLVGQSAHRSVHEPNAGPCSAGGLVRSEEHTSELQSLAYLVC